MNVVLFGDSNTYGYNPVGDRYENRYSNILKRHYMNRINIYEEGLVGRTTIYDDLNRPNRSSLGNVDIILSKYNEIDLLVIMLGTNDYKKTNAKSKADLRYGMESLLKKIKNLNIKNILLISPILLSENISDLDNEFDYSSYLLSKDASLIYKGIANDYDTLFLDASDYASPGIDGEHLDEVGHFNLGKKIAKVIDEFIKNEED